MYLILITIVTVNTYVQGIPTLRNTSSISSKKSLSSISQCYFAALDNSYNKPDLDKDECSGITSDNRCGVPKNLWSKAKSRQTRIISYSDGEVADGKWPWMAYIFQIRGCSAVCGGSLINNRWIITAAQCFEDAKNANPSEYGVILGEHRLSVRSGRERYSLVKKINVHRYYNSETLNYDVALMQLKRSVRYTPYIKPVCLAPCGTNTDNIDNSRTSFAGRTCVTLGWGFSTNAGPRSDTLKQLDVIVAPKSLCIQLTLKYLSRVKRRDAKICAGGIAGQGVCTGDVGGPLLCQHNDGKYYLHGITSSGPNPCAKTNMPDVYTEIGDPVVNNWITATVSCKPTSIRNFQSLLNLGTCRN